jgi:hypothetical protein
MSAETLIPTHGLRLYVAESGASARLQQRFTTPAGAEIWRDVPKVTGHGEPWLSPSSEDAARPPKLGAPFETVAEAYASDERASRGIAAAFLAGAEFGAMRTANEFMAEARKPTPASHDQAAVKAGMTLGYYEADMPIFRYVAGERTQIHPDMLTDAEILQIAEGNPCFFRQALRNLSKQPDTGSEAPSAASPAPFSDVTGFGASYQREEDHWVIYTMPGAKRIGAIDGYDKDRFDWIVEALRAAHSHPSCQGPSRGSAKACPCGDNDGFPCSLPGCPYAVSTSFDRSAPIHSTEFLESRVNKAYDTGRKHAIEEMLGTNVAVLPKPAFQLREKVEKWTGDYRAKGEVRGIFPMKNGAIRFVVEHQAEGGGSFCHIYSEKNLRRVEE